MDEGSAEAAKRQTERIQYRILYAVHQRAGGSCTHSITAAEMGAELPDVENLLPVLDRLHAYDYLFEVGPDHRFCITPKGIRYIERSAGRRRSLRLPSLGWAL